MGQQQQLSVDDDQLFTHTYLAFGTINSLKFKNDQSIHSNITLYSFVLFLFLLGFCFFDEGIEENYIILN